MRRLAVAVSTPVYAVGVALVNLADTLYSYGTG